MLALIQIMLGMLWKLMHTVILIGDYYFLVTLPIGVVRRCDPSWEGNTQDMEEYQHVALCIFLLFI